jgi:hypothetical protein
MHRAVRESAITRWSETLTRFQIKKSVLLSSNISAGEAEQDLSGGVLLTDSISWLCRVLRHVKPPVHQASARLHKHSQSDLNL